jgi:glycosyltransferase involved in cell wall biosynthesis
MGGAEIFLLRAIPFLQNVEAKVFFIGESGPMIKAMNSAGIETEQIVLPEVLVNRRANEKVGFKSLSAMPLAFFSARREIMTSLEKFGAEVVYTNSAKSHLLGAAAAKKMGIPVLSHMHDALKGGNFGRLNQAVIYFALRFLPKVVLTNSSFTKASLGSRFWKNSPVIVDCSLPKWEKAPRSRSFDESPIVFGALNRITRWKGQDKLMEIFYEARKYPLFRDARLLIVGSPGSFEDEIFKYELWSKAKSLKLADAVEFRPFTDEIEKTLDEIDLFIHYPATPEPFGQSILEAQSRGCAVMTSIPSGAQDFVRDGVNGFSSNLEINDSRSIASKLANISLDELRRCSVGAIENNNGRFDPQTIATHLEELLEITKSEKYAASFSSQPKVAHLDHENRRGGAEFALARLLINRRGWRPKVFIDLSVDSGVFSESMNTFGRNQISDTNWQTRPLKVQGRMTFKSVLEVAITLVLVGRRLRKSPEFKSCEIVHANTTRSLVSAVVAKRRGQQILFHVRDDLSRLVTGYFGSSLAKKLLFRRVDSIVSNSQYSLSTLGKIPKRIFSEVIPSPIGTFTRDGEEQTPMLRTPQGNRVICMLARLSPWKGQMLLLEAFAGVVAEFPKVELWLAGSSDFESGNFRQELIGRARELGLESRVHFLGHVSQVPELLEKVDICVQYSARPEPMGQNVLQYLAAGKASIVASEGGPREWVEHMANGLQCTPRNTEALKAALLLLLKDQQLKQKLEANAKLTIPANFDSQVIEQFQRALSHLSSRKTQDKRL